MKIIFLFLFLLSLSVNFTSAKKKSKSNKDFNPLTHFKDISQDVTDKLYVKNPIFKIFELWIKWKKKKIFTNDGKIYAYSIKHREISWVVDLNIKFVNFIYNQNPYPEMQSEDSYFFPTLDGNFLFYSKVEGFYVKYILIS